MDEKYPMETAAQGYGSNSALVGSARRMDITLRQNIDERIKQAQRATCSRVGGHQGPHGEVRHPGHADRRHPQGDAVLVNSRAHHGTATKR
jgi:hypothetical protein